MTEEANDSEVDVVIEQPKTQADVEVQVDEQDQVETPKQNTDLEKEEWVEIKDPAVQKRVNNLFKQVKMSDQRNKLKDEMLEKAMKRIDELENRFKQTDESQAEQIILTRIQEARDNGDTAAELKLISELTDFKAEQKIKGIQQPKQAQQIDFGLPEEDVNYIVDAVYEKDESGKYVRPWLHQDNPRYQTTMRQSAIISAEVESELGYVDPREVMTRLEKVMNQKQAPQRPANNRAPDPLQSGLTNRSARNTLKLSPAEAAIAEKLGIDHKSYAQSREALKRK